MKVSSALSERAMLQEIGARAQQYRVGMNLTQRELAELAGVAPRTVERLEAGNSVQLDKLLRILRALRLSENLDQVIPEASVRPMQLAGSKSEVRRRASKRGKATRSGSGWVWGNKK
jgi:transcriptional regulator with XRE-family HTH domain